MVVANPASGRGRGGRVIPRVERLLSSLAVDHEILISAGPDDPERMAREAARGGAEVVAALGGDGLAGMVANGLVGTPTALAVIPTGTGNDFACNLGLHRRRPVEAAALLRDPSITSIDVGRITAGPRTRHYVNVAGAGFDSEVNELANRWQTRLSGAPKYVAAVLRTLVRFSPGQFEVTVDGEQQTIPAMMIAVGNGPAYGGGMRICPDASLTDGILEVCVVGSMGRGEFLSNFPRVFRGTHVHHPKVTMLRGSRVEVRADRAFQVYADGEHVGPVPAVFQVLPGALRVVVPRKLER